MDDQARKLATKIEERRLDRGLTKAALARAVGVTRQVVNNWYSGRTWPKPKEMILLAKALGTSISYLYGETADPRPAPEWSSTEGTAAQEAAALLRQALQKLDGGKG